MQKDDIKHLANLARLDLTDDEIAKYTEDVSGILGFIDQIKDAPVKDSNSQGDNLVLKNVFREDNDIHESGIFTEDLLKEAPETQDNFVKVKKILNNND